MTEPSGTAIKSFVQAMSASSSPLVDPELAEGELLRNRAGVPHYAVGRLTVTFVTDTARGRRVVRMFHRPVPEAADRYRHIVSALQVSRHPQIAWYRYMADGIKLRDGMRPVSIRPWMDGVNLNQALAIDRSKSNIEKIQASFARIITHLRASGLAHGNIHHGNLIFTRDRELVLVDPECMYTPRIRQYLPLIAPHRNYGGNVGAQIFGAQMDEIPARVIEMGLDLLREQSHRWFAFDSGDNVLLSDRDLENPNKSSLLRSVLDGEGPVSWRARQFIRSLIEPTWTVNPGCRRLVEIDRNTTIIGTLDVDSLAEDIGNDVTVVGRVFRATPNCPPSGPARVFLNFGHRRDGALSVILRYAALATACELASQYDRQWIYARGRLRRSGDRTDQRGHERIDLWVDKPTNIRIINVADAAGLMRGS